QWQHKAESLLLQSQHHHWVFTLPHDLHIIWRFNRALCQRILFQSVRKTIRKLCKDERYLAATPGYILALHTWARNQVFHPHIHCMISHGGLDVAGQWRTPKRKCFLPAKVMMQIFRGKFLAGLKEALATNELVVPRLLCSQQVINLCNKLGRVDWVLHCVKPYEHGYGVAKYLARYIRGGAIKNSQLLNVANNCVVFRYQSHQTKKTEYLKLSHEQFMQRLLEHFAIPRKQQYQMLGLYHGCCKDKLNQAREQLGQRAVNEDKELSWQEFLESNDQMSRCEQCGKPLTVLKPLVNNGEEMGLLKNH
uniref:IS91 family transposase n=1 Tax=Psychromonas hadalis TaxID=211669 RepID=UPI0003B3FE6E